MVEVGQAAKQSSEKYVGTMRSTVVVSGSEISQQGANQDEMNPAGTGLCVTWTHT